MKTFLFRAGLLASVLAICSIGVAVAPAGAQAASHAPKALPAHAQKAVCHGEGTNTAACAAHVVTETDGATPLATSSYTYGYRPTDLASGYMLESATPAEEPNQIIEPPKPTA